MLKTKRVVCVDAGHEKFYNQSPVVPEYYESVFNFKLQEELKVELPKLGIGIVTTRDSLDEVRKDLTGRGHDSKGCDAFCSLHSNACGTESVKRIAVYHLRPDDLETIDEEAYNMGIDLGEAILEVMPFCEEFRMETRAAKSDRDGDGYHDDEYYGVLQGAKEVGTPAILLEHGFHTNTETAEWLLKDENIHKLAVAEARAWYKYFARLEGSPLEPDVEETTVEEEVVEEPTEPSSPSDANSFPEDAGDSWYRVRKSWEDKDSQIGAFKSLINAVSVAKANPGYSVYFEDGVKYDYKYYDRVFNTDYPKEAVVETRSKVGLNVRVKPRLGSMIIGSLPYGSPINILEEKDGWGKVLLNGKPGWLSLKYTLER